MTENNQSAGPSEDTESEYHKQDLKRVIFGNLFFLALLIGLYFVNQRFGVLSYLEKLF